MTCLSDHAQGKEGYGQRRMVIVWRSKSSISPETEDAWHRHVTPKTRRGVYAPPGRLSGTKAGKDYKDEGNSRCRTDHRKKSRSRNTQGAVRPRGTCRIEDRGVEPW